MERNEGSAVAEDRRELFWIAGKCVCVYVCVSLRVIILMSFCLGFGAFV